MLAIYPPVVLLYVPLCATVPAWGLADGMEAEAKGGKT